MSRYHVYTEVLHHDNTPSPGSTLSVYADELKTTLLTLYAHDSPDATTIANPYTVPGNSWADFYVTIPTIWIVAGTMTDPAPMDLFIDTGGEEAVIPTGTGFTHITAGVQDAAAQLVADADVDPAAAVEESKLDLNYPTHAQQHVITSATDHTFPGGTTTFLRADGTYATPAAGGSVPTGTGFRHVTGGAEDGASKLVVNTDVDAAAAIVESKLGLNYATHSRAHVVTSATDHTFPGGTTTYLRADGSFATPPGGSASITAGAGVPAGGSDGDFYIRSSTADFYQKITGTWTILFNMKGATGPAGTTDYTALSNKPTLGTAAALDVGTGAGNVAAGTCPVVTTAYIRDTLGAVIGHGVKNIYEGTQATYPPSGMSNTDLFVDTD